MKKPSIAQGKQPQLGILLLLLLLYTLPVPPPERLSLCLLLPTHRVWRGASWAID